MLVTLKNEFPDALILAIVDDIYILAPPIISVNCFLRMCALAEENSEIVKLGKCHAFSPTEATMSHPALDNLPDGVIKHPSHGRGLGDDKRLHAGVRKNCKHQIAKLHKIANTKLQIAKLHKIILEAKPDGRPADPARSTE